ncbi:hypothetical protein [Pseudobdellovibrio sp. HCB154]|uniref:hypothetical protein n=1 Tax=Pseudobdellovibrio sp. HCB154 TaxID=3386277 RepID=UPI00391722CE
MKNHIKLALVFLVIVFNSVCFAGDLENTVLLQLLENTNKTAKNHCEMGSGKTVKIKDFLAGYINWTFASKTLDSKFLKCDKLDSGKDEYNCDFKYSEKSKAEQHPGWDIDLEFKYKVGKGIDWRSVQCVSTP